MNPPIIRRPAILQEVAGESRTYADFGLPLKDFPAVRLLLLRDTPSVFKDKNLFIFDSALKAA